MSNNTNNTVDRMDHFLGNIFESFLVVYDREKSKPLVRIIEAWRNEHPQLASSLFSPAQPTGLDLKKLQAKFDKVLQETTPEEFEKWLNEKVRERPGQDDIQESNCSHEDTKNSVQPAQPTDDYYSLDLNKIDEYKKMPDGEKKEFVQRCVRTASDILTMAFEIGNLTTHIQYLTLDSEGTPFVLSFIKHVNAFLQDKIVPAKEEPAQPTEDARKAWDFQEYLTDKGYDIDQIDSKTQLAEYKKFCLLKQSEPAQPLEPTEEIKDWIESEGKKYEKLGSHFSDDWEAGANAMYSHLQPRIDELEYKLTSANVIIQKMAATISQYPELLNGIADDEVSDTTAADSSNDDDYQTALHEAKHELPLPASQRKTESKEPAPTDWEKYHDKLQVLNEIITSFAHFSYETAYQSWNHAERFDAWRKEDESKSLLSGLFSTVGLWWVKADDTKPTKSGVAKYEGMTGSIIKHRNGDLEFNGVTGCTIPIKRDEQFAKLEYLDESPSLSSLIEQVRSENPHVKTPTGFSMYDAWNAALDKLIEKLK